MQRSFIFNVSENESFNMQIHSNVIKEKEEKTPVWITCVFNALFQYIYLINPFLAFPSKLLTSAPNASSSQTSSCGDGSLCTHGMQVPFSSWESKNKRGQISARHPNVFFSSLFLLSLL